MTTLAKRSGKSAAEAPFYARYFKRLWQWEGSGVLVALIVLIIMVSLYTDKFLTPFNGQVIARQVAYIGLVALAQTLVLLIGGIDLNPARFAALFTRNSANWTGGTSVERLVSPSLLGSGIR